MKNRLSVITFIAMITVAGLFSAVLIYNLSTLSSKHLANTEKKLKEVFIKRQKEQIKKELHRLIERINFEKGQVYSDARDTVKSRVTSADELLNKFVKLDTSGNMVKIAIDGIVHSYKWEYDSGYYFALDRDGKILHHGGNIAFEGKSVYSLGFNSDLTDFLKTAYQNGEAFGEYNFEKPNEPGVKYYKIAYAKYNRETGILLGASIYLDEIMDKAKENILNSIKTDRYGFQDMGYFWVLTPDYKNVFHPSESFAKADLKNLKEGGGRYLLRDVISIATENGAGFLTYLWPEPGSKEFVEKVAYVEYVPDWNWIIGTGFYFNNYKEIADLEREVIEVTTKDDLYSNLILISILFVSTILVSIYVAKKLGKVEAEQSKVLNDLQQYKRVMDESSVVSITDPMGHITYVNDKFCQISGYSREFLIGKRHNIMRHPDTPNEIFGELWSTILKGHTWHGVIKNLKADGTHFYHNATIIPYVDENGHIVSFTSCSQDVTEVVENRVKLQNVFSTDRLTGLGNRYKLLKDIEQAKMPSLAFVDIDRFHEINELYGMKIGDELLSMLAKRMINNPELRYFNIYRLHSDVFAILAPSIEQNQFISKFTNGMEACTKEIFILDGKEVVISYRSGIASELENTMSKADIALQQAKTENKPYVIYDSHTISNADAYEQNIKVVKMLNEALDKDRVVPFYQPIYNYATKKIEKYECLIRIVNDDGSIIPPSHFLAVSKQTRLYPRLTKIMATKAIETFRNLNYEFSINFSVEDLLNNDTMDTVFNYAKEADVFKKMVIEIVETEQLSASHEIVSTISRFKAEGTKIAIDDFGTGYSNFDYLLKVHADYIKIDGSIIKLITKDDRAVDIVNSIIRYARKMGMKTIAEFISDKDIAQKAASLYIDYGQGFYHGKPEIKPNPKAENDI